MAVDGRSGMRIVAALGGNALLQRGNHDARLIVLGSTSRADLPRLPLGSVATRLLHMSTRPALIVPKSYTPAQATEATGAPAAAAATATGH